MRLPALGALACPNCGRGLDQTDRRLHCSSGHSFDLAKHGYAPLLAPGSNATTGDTAGQVADRAAFLSSGVYDPLLAAVAAASDVAAPGVVAEPGCGTGHYLAAALDADDSREGIGLDTSKFALRRTARRDRTAAVLADAWNRAPVRDGAAAAVLNVFAPRNADQIARMLHPEGVLVVLTPREDHLRELVAALALLQVDPEKTRRTADQLGGRFTEAASEVVRYEAVLERDDVRRLAGMGPSARHRGPQELDEAVAALPETVSVTISAAVTRWRPRPG